MLFKDSSYEFVSPVSIGGKIKRIRELRGWSQKELGIRCGFSESTADVRIRQYESNKKIPREKAIKVLADALGIDENSLFDADLIVETRALHALFDIEDMHALHPEIINDRYCLVFGGTKLNGANVTNVNQNSFIRQWIEEREKSLPDTYDTEEDKKRKRKEYDLWRYEYPINVANKNTERLLLRAKKSELEKQLKEVNKRLNIDTDNDDDDEE